MKHIKKFNENISNRKLISSHIVYDIKDMLLDMIDDDIKFNIAFYTSAYRRSGTSGWCHTNNIESFSDIIESIKIQFLDNWVYAKDIIYRILAYANTMNIDYALYYMLYSKNGTPGSDRIEFNKKSDIDILINKLLEQNGYLELFIYQF